MNALTIRHLALALLAASTSIALAAPAHADDGYGDGRHRDRDRHDSSVRFVVERESPSSACVRSGDRFGISFSGVVGGVGVDAAYACDPQAGAAYQSPSCDRAVTWLDRGDGRGSQHQTNVTYESWARGGNGRGRGGSRADSRGRGGERRDGRERGDDPSWGR